MTANVSPEEQQALLEQSSVDAAVPVDVTQRDFSEPRRIPSSALTELCNQIDRMLPEIQLSARRVLGADVLLHVGGVTESSAARLADSWKPPYALLRFTSGGQVCWVSMDCASAVAELERLVGAEPQHTARPLSSSEHRLLILIAEVLFEPLRPLLGFEFRDLRAVTEPYDVGNWRHGDGAPDPHRLTIELQVERPDGRSSMRLHVLPPVQQRRKEPDTRAPGVEHIQDLDLELSARLSSLELPLEELLALEVGDVLPLGVPVGTQLGLFVNDLPWAQASLGARGTRLAVALHSVIQGQPRN
jgi:flagellar motor switch protein FliM